MRWSQGVVSSPRLAKWSARTLPGAPEWDFTQTIRTVWRIDNTIVPSSPKSKGHHYSIIVLLDQESDDRMQSWVSEVEQRIREQGIPIRFSRSVQQPFHSTLGVVNGLEFPLETALAAVNTVVRPHSWTGGENITLEGPPNF